VWETKTFKTNEQKKNWIEANASKYRIEEVFINNGYAVEYKKLIVIDI